MRICLYQTKVYPKFERHCWTWFISMECSLWSIIVLQYGRQAAGHCHGKERGSRQIREHCPAPIVSCCVKLHHTKLNVDFALLHPSPPLNTAILPSQTHHATHALLSKCRTVEKWMMVENISLDCWPREGGSIWIFHPCSVLLCTINYCLQSHIVRCETHFARGLNFQVDVAYYVHRIQKNSQTMWEPTEPKVQIFF